MIEILYGLGIIVAAYVGLRIVSAIFWGVALKIIEIIEKRRKK